MCIKQLMLFVLLFCNLIFLKANNSKIETISKAIANNTPNNIVKSNISGTPSTIYPNMFYEFRLENLNKTSPLRLDYNADVQKYIDMYLKERPQQVAFMLGMSKLYFPIFETCLDKYNLPLELKYLPYVESGLIATAQSRSGAMGLWQLLLNSSKLLGLEVNSYTDERCDPYKSTDAACRYLRYLYSVFNDWQLALAAYNGGPGEVRNAIIRSGGKTDFWEIQAFLPEQTKWYVPAFIAALYIGNFANQHGIAAIDIAYNFEQIDTLNIDEAVELEKLSEKLNISIDNIKMLNPTYRRNFIPDSEKPQTLVLPIDKITMFLEKQNQIYAEKTYKPTYIDAVSNAGDTQGLKRTIYTVEPGDFLHKIALQKGCTPENIRAWNHLQTDNLSAGQKLNIWVELNFENKSDIKKAATVPDSAKKTIYYNVKKGDTFWSIAERFGVSSINQLKTDNNISDTKPLLPGQKLKIVVW